MKSEFILICYLATMIGSYIRVQISIEYNKTFFNSIQLLTNRSIIIGWLFYIPSQSIQRKHMQSFTAGVSNSNNFLGRIRLQKAGRGPHCMGYSSPRAARNWNWWSKLCFTYKICMYILHVGHKKAFAGRKKALGRPHAARGPRVWDPCFKAFLFT